MNKVIGAICVVATLASATAASARMTDREYMQAARCRALAASTTLGAVDTTAIDQRLREESHGRDPYIADRADSIRRTAERDASRANDNLKERLLAERNTTCRSYLEA